MLEGILRFKMGWAWQQKHQKCRHTHGRNIYNQGKASVPTFILASTPLVFCYIKHDLQINSVHRIISQALTSRWMQDLAVLVAPAHGEDEWRVPVCPEVVAFRPAIKVHSEPRPLDLHYCTHADVGRVLRVDTLQFIVLLKRVVWFWKYIQRWVLLEDKRNMLKVPFFINRAALTFASIWRG